MELTAVYRCVAALDAHQAKLTVCVLSENDLGEVVTEVREFGGFKRDRREMAAWVASFHPASTFSIIDGFVRCRLRAMLRKQKHRPGQGRCLRDHKQ